MTKIGKTYRKYKDGQRMTNAEVLEAWKHFCELSNLLVKSGEAFSIAFYEAARMRNNFEQICLARELITFSDIK